MCPIVNLYIINRILMYVHGCMFYRLCKEIPSDNIKETDIQKHVSDNTTEQKQQLSFNLLHKHRKKMISDGTTKKKHKIIIMVPCWLC